MINYIIKFIYILISLLDKFDFNYIKHGKLLDNYKTTEEHTLQEDLFYIYTDSGFQPLSHFLLTKPFEQYTIILENGYEFTAADEHTVFDEYMHEVYVDDLREGDYIQTDKGISKVKSIIYNSTKLSMCDVSVNDENHRFYANGILHHNSVVTAIYCLWKMLFNVDKQGLILSKSGAAGVDLLKKIKDMFLHLPYYLKPGIYKWNQTSVAFDNNSNIGTEAFSPTAGLGKTINFLILDEFAWCPPNETELFYMNIIPTITTQPDSNVCIMSTQNGFNFFHEIWVGANKPGDDWNGYAPFKTDWDEVPNYNMEKHCWEKRDDAWKKKMIGILGSEENFYYQYGTTFSASDKCLLNRTKLGELHKNQIKYLNLPALQKYYIENYNIELELNISLIHPEALFFDPTFDLRELKTGYFIVLCDLAEGCGGDYTTFNIIQILEKDRFKQVGYFHSNEVNLELSSLEFWLIASQLFATDHAIYSIEWNTYGQLFYTYLSNLNSNDYMQEYAWRFNISDELDLSLIIRYTTKFEVEEQGIKVKKTKKVPGIRLNASNKVTGCSLLKLLIENGYLLINDYYTITEIENFEDKSGNGSYSASYGHDDIVMTLVQIPMLQQTPRYKSLIEDMKEYNQINDMVDYQSPYLYYDENY